MATEPPWAAATEPPWAAATEPPWAAAPEPPWAADRAMSPHSSVGTLAPRPLVRDAPPQPVGAQSGSVAGRHSRRSAAQVSLAPLGLLCVLTVQALLSLRLAWSNTAVQIGRAHV